MSTSLATAMTATPPAATAAGHPDSAAQRLAARQLRAATVRRRLCLATDALAAADLLLGVNWSLRTIGGRPGRGDS